ncbi:hypothetical protein [Streptomyces sp. NPDC058373]|uniref:hypothetical protein n=1 Tax=unclassified Streptomyces TaxID=2593676 RepID=UPI00366583F8
MSPSDNGTQVLVVLTGADAHDARIVFDALGTAFAPAGPDEGRAAAEDDKAGASLLRSALYETAEQIGHPKAAAPLRTAVNLTLQGDYGAVDAVSEVLSEAFRLENLGEAPGDQEKEVEMRLHPHQS